jgi:hypothetical protein
LNDRRPARIRPDLAVAAAVGGFAFVVLAAGIEGSPLQPILPPGLEPMLPFRAAARGVGLDSLQPLFQATVAIVAVIAATLTFLYALRAAWRGHVSVRTVAVIGVAFAAVAVALPLLFSRDVYSYSMYGRIASLHHANPYVSTPQDFARDPMFPLVGPQWRGTTAVYGPAFTLLSSVLTRWLRTPESLILAFKVIAGVAEVLTFLLVAWLARRVWPERAAFATMLVAWNPVVVFHGVGGGHNDLLVGLAVVAALCVLARGRRRSAADGGRERSPRSELVATAVLALGTLVKATAAIPLFLLIVASVWRRPREERVRWMAAHVGIAAALFGAFAAPFFQLHDPTFGLATLATHEGWLAPSRFFRVILGHVGHAVGGGIGQTVAEALVRVAFPLVFVVAFAAIVRWVARAEAASSGTLDAMSPRAAGAVWGWGLLVGTLAAPVLLPWYIVWALPVVWLLPRTARSSAILLSGLLTVSQTVAAAVHFPAIFHATLFVGHYVLTPVLFVTFVVLLRDLARRLTDSTGLLAEVDAGPAPRDEERDVAAHAHRG